MAVLQPKKKPVIQKGKGYVYQPDKFPKQKNFFVVDTPEELLERIKPLEFMGKKLIALDSQLKS